MGAGISKLGLGLQEPQSPVAVGALALSLPSLYTRFLRMLEQIGKDNGMTAAEFGNMLKAYGTPFFILGHGLICKKAGAVTAMDTAYIVACIFLGTAFWYGHKKSSFPEMVPASGLGLIVFGTMARNKMLAANVMPTPANIAIAAGSTLVYLGAQMLMLRGKMLEKPLPGLTLPQLGQLASVLFGTANFAKFFSMVQAGAPWDDAFIGQCCKITASSCLASGNALILGWQKTVVPGESVANLATVMAVAALVAKTASA